MKKIIAVTALSGVVFLTSASTVNGFANSKAVSQNAQTSQSQSNLGEISGSFSGDLHEGMGTKPVPIGTVEYVVPPVITLNVINGGPENLTWSAAIYDVTTNKLVCDWTEFQHGYGNLLLPIDRSNVKVGDSLQLWLHANSGSGHVILKAGQ